jgi:hypothetical protein
MTTWYSLEYTSASGRAVKLHNLQIVGATDIERAQRALGSHSLVRTEQTHHLSHVDVYWLNLAEENRAAVLKANSKPTKAEETRSNEPECRCERLLYGHEPGCPYVMSRLGR